MGQSVSGSLFDQCLAVATTERTRESSGGCRCVPYCDTNEPTAASGGQRPINDPYEQYAGCAADNQKCKFYDVAANQSTTDTAQGQRNANDPYDQYAGCTDNQKCKQLYDVANSQSQSNGCDGWSQSENADGTASSMMRMPSMGNRLTGRGTPTAGDQLSAHRGSICDLKPRPSLKQRKSLVPKKPEGQTTTQLQIDEVAAVQPLLIYREPSGEGAQTFEPAASEQEMDDKFKEAGIFRFRSSKARSSCAIVKEDQEEE